MKICFLSRLFSPFESGAEKTARELSEELSKNGHKVDVITTNPNNKHKKIENKNNYKIIRLYWFEKNPIAFINYTFHDFCYIFRIMYLTIQNKYDIIVCFSANAFGIPAVFIKKVLNIPLLLITNESNLDINKILKNKKSIISRLFDYYRNITKKIVVNNASKILLKVTCKKEFVNYFNIEENKVILINNPVKINFVKNFNDTSTDEINNIINNKFVILFANKLNYLKGIDLLPKIAKILKTSIPDFLLIICGKGELSSDIKKEIFNVRLKDNILFLGYRNDIDYLLSICDVVIKTDRGETCCGHSQIEAMAMGKPVIIGKTKSQNYWFKHLHDIYFVQERTAKSFADAILYLKNNNSIRREIGTNAKLTIEKNWRFESFVNKVETICREIIIKN